MYNFEKYISNKCELLKSADEIKAKIKELDGMGIDVSETLRKIDNAKSIIQNDKISIVLVGAFSDGKTSVAAGWLNEKMDDMKIDTDESSDEILCYTPATIPEGCQIIDTPGLFGNKMGRDENGDSIALSDKTKRYISEANLILYVVTAKNPIKDSHKDCIRWILKELNKLDTTIFVINRMDDVADMTDDDDYALQARIKSENLRNKLVDCGLTPEAAQAVRIACVSAAPDGKGIDEWEGYREEYLRRSRLGSLEAVTNEILQDSRQQLIVKTGCDILNDEIKKTLDIIKDEVYKSEAIILPEQKKALKHNKDDLAQLEKRLLRSRADIKEELAVLEKKKIACIRAATMENFGDILEDEIGILTDNNGYRLNEEVNAIFDKYYTKHIQWIGEMGDSMTTEYEKQNEMIQSLLSQGTNAVSKGLQGTKYIGSDVIKAGIFKGRDLLNKFGKTIKFKPWQVTKMANFATKTLPVIGAAISIISDVSANYKEQKRNKEFEASKSDIKKNVKELFKALSEQLNNNETYFTDFAPEYGTLLAQIKQDEAELHTQEKQLKEFKAWEKKVVDSDFTLC